MNYGSDTIHEHNYIFFFDQEPIHLNIHTATFDTVQEKNMDLTHTQGRHRPPLRNAGILITSEQNSATVQQICERYKWKSLYYFFHGWAALDWYRGYNRTFLIPPFQKRQPTKTFISPNRIIAGERQHRLEMLYHIFKHNLDHNHISCPVTCPAENISIYDAIKPLVSRCPDIESVFAKTQLPIQFCNETDHPMHSCWLSLFDESADSLLYLVTETVATGQRWHLTEKTFKPIAMGMPFVIVGTKGSLEYLRSYGFRTFEGIWDESYDRAEDHERIACVAQLLRSLDDMTVQQRQHIYQQCHEVIAHNWNHFYNGGFEARLWKELETMLDDVKSCL